MKIAWFTPFAVQSAIGNYSRFATAALSREHSVTIFTPKAEHYHETRLKVVPFCGTEAVSQLPQYDLAVYNLGDNSTYHADIYDTAQAYPGILVLHDIGMLNFVNGYFLAHQDNLDGYRQKITGMYGEEACRRICEAMQSQAAWSRMDLLRYNCLPEIVRGAKGVVVHSQYHKGFVESCYGGPIQVAYFPYPADEPDCSGHPEKGKAGRIELLTVGNVNANKRIYPVIEAIASDRELSERIHYTVAGALAGEYAEGLKQLVKEKKLEKAVSLEGSVSNERLERLYGQADLLINLRKPAIEGASWSLLEQMEKGLPILVYNAGFYSEMPDDCLFKLEDGRDEVEAIRQALHEILDDEAGRKEKGKNAREYAKRAFNPDNYRKAWDQMFSRLAFIKPIEELAASVRYELQIMGLTGEERVIQTAAEEMDRMFARYQGMVE